MEVFTINLNLNLLLPHIVLTHVTTYSSESMNSSIMNLLHTNTPACDSENFTQRFKSLAPLMTSDASNFYSTRSWVSSRNIAGRRIKRVLGTKTLDL